MSIATDEAAKLPIPANLYKKADLDHNVITFEGANAIAEAAYIAGRTAEPTEAEIKAAVRAMYYRHAADWESDEDYARHLLEAARKAVMGDERGY